MPKGCMALIAGLAGVLLLIEAWTFLTRERFESVRWRESGTLASEHYASLGAGPAILRAYRG